MSTSNYAPSKYFRTAVLGIFVAWTITSCILISGFTLLNAPIFAGCVVSMIFLLDVMHTETQLAYSRGFTSAYGSINAPLEADAATTVPT
jgi:hypothetical protein